MHDFLVPPCGGDNQCMKQITLEEVEGLCTRLLRGDRSTVPAENLRFNRAGADGALGVVNRL